MTSILIYPVFFYVLLQFMLLIYLFLGRLKAVKTKEVKGSFFLDYRDGQLPKDLQIISRAFDNQFQVPILFFITVLFAMVLKIDSSPFILICSWVFVITRLLHFYFHAIKKTIIGRYRTYALGWLMILFIWINILVHNLQG